MVSKKKALLVIILCFFAPIILLAAATQINLVSQVFGILPTANGGTGSAFFAISGPTVARTYTLPDSSQTIETQNNKDAAAGYAGLSSSLLKCAEAFALTGDTTMASGACATVVAKINGTTVPTNAAADQVLQTTASATSAWKTLPDCQDATGNHLNYTVSTHTWSCGTTSTGGVVPNFADSETPGGLINGANVTYTLAHTPNPAASLECVENGLVQRIGAGTDFTLATATITYLTAPATGSTLVCYYRW